MAKPDRKELHRIKRAVLAASDHRPTLSEFLGRLNGVHPDLDAALEGIYCGHEGRITEPIGDWGHHLCFNWYSTEGRKHVVEWAYIS
jgi:hypothetical protein